MGFAVQRKMHEVCSSEQLMEEGPRSQVYPQPLGRSSHPKIDEWLRYWGRLWSSIGVVVEAGAEDAEASRSRPCRLGWVQHPTKSSRVVDHMIAEPCMGRDGDDPGTESERRM
jgi:hypothetical protein